jgi:hypothetical protein
MEPTIFSTLHEWTTEGPVPVRNVVLLVLSCGSRNEIGYLQIG